MGLFVFVFENYYWERFLKTPRTLFWCFLKTILVLWIKYLFIFFVQKEKQGNQMCSTCFPCSLWFSEQRTVLRNCSQTGPIFLIPPWILFYQMYICAYMTWLLSNVSIWSWGLFKGNHIHISSMKLPLGLVSQSLAPYEVSLKLETRYCALKAFSGWSNTF